MSDDLIKKYFDYQERLRFLVPARTMTFFTSITGLYPAILKPGEVPSSTLTLIVVGVCLVFQLILGLTDHKPWLIILLSAISFCLYATTLPFIGILASVKFDHNFIYYLIVGGVIGYVIFIPMIFKDYFKKKN